MLQREVMVEASIHLNPNYVSQSRDIHNALYGLMVLKSLLRANETDNF